MYNRELLLEKELLYAELDRLIKANESSQEFSRDVIKFLKRENQHLRNEMDFFKEFYNQHSTDNVKPNFSGKIVKDYVSPLIDRSI